MGRTLPTVNQVLEENRAQWSRFYRALRKEDRALLDRLFDGAKYFTAACVYQVHVTPSESIMLAMLLHLEKELQELHRRLGVEAGTGHGVGQGPSLGGANELRGRLHAGRGSERLLLTAGKK